MTAAEYHQQQLEQQEQEDVAHGMNLNHGRFVGVARFIRDNAKSERDIQDALKYILRTLEDYEQLDRRVA